MNLHEWLADYVIMGSAVAIVYLMWIGFLCQRNEVTDLVSIILLIFLALVSAALWPITLPITLGVILGIVLGLGEGSRKD